MQLKLITLKKVLLLNSLFLATNFLLGQAATVQFTTVVDGAAGGFLNDTLSNGGVPTDGMNWGLVVDTSGGGTGFGALTSNGLSHFDPTINYQNISPNLTYTFGGSGTLSTVTALGEVGAITTVTSIDLSSGIVASDPFAVVWFPVTPTTGSIYGVLTNASFVIPNAGETVSYAGLPIFEGAGSFEPNYSFAVPEPSTYAAIVGLLSLGFVMWRRRK